MKPPRRPRAPMGRQGRSAQLPLLVGDQRRAVTALSRATAKRGRRTREAGAPMPWLAVVLAVDTARRSGWCISVCGQRVDSGELDTDTVEAGTLLPRLVRWAHDLGELQGVPVVMVLETPWGGSAVIVAALGAARERWLRAWRDAGESRGRVVLVQPSTWRAAVLGSASVGMKRDEIRGVEGLAAALSMGRQVVRPDEAAAVLIAQWGARSAAVGKAIGVRAQRASVASWTGGEA